MDVFTGRVGTAGAAPTGAKLSNYLPHKAFRPVRSSCRCDASSEQTSEGSSSAIAREGISGSRQSRVERFFRRLKATALIRNAAETEEEVATRRVKLWPSRIVDPEEVAAGDRAADRDTETADEFFRDKGPAAPGLAAFSLVDAVILAIRGEGLTDDRVRTPLTRRRRAPGDEDWSAFAKYDAFQELLSTSPLLQEKRFGPLKALLAVSSRGSGRAGKYDFVAALLRGLASEPTAAHEWDLVHELLHRGRREAETQAPAGGSERLRKYDMVFDLLHETLIVADWGLPASGPAHDLLHFDEWGSREHDPFGDALRNLWHGGVKYEWDPLVAAFSATAPTVRAEWDPLQALLAAPALSGRRPDSKYDPVRALLALEPEPWRTEIEALQAAGATPPPTKSAQTKGSEPQLGASLGLSAVDSQPGPGGAAAVGPPAAADPLATANSSAAPENPTPVRRGLFKSPRGLWSRYWSSQAQSPGSAPDGSGAADADEARRLRDQSRVDGRGGPSDTASAQPSASGEGAASFGNRNRADSGAEAGANTAVEAGSDPASEGWRQFWRPNPALDTPSPQSTGGFRRPAAGKSAKAQAMDRKVEHLREEWRRLSEQSDVLRQKFGQNPPPSPSRRATRKPQPRSFSQQQVRAVSPQDLERQSEGIRRQLADTERRRKSDSVKDGVSRDLVPDILRLEGALRAAPVAGYDPIAVLEARGGQEQIQAVTSAFRDLRRDPALAKRLLGGGRVPLALPPPGASAAGSEDGAVLRDLEGERAYSPLLQLLTGHEAHALGTIRALGALTASERRRQ